MPDAVHHGKSSPARNRSVFLLLILLFGRICAEEQRYEITVFGRVLPVAFDQKRQVLVLEKKDLAKLPASSLADLLALAGGLVFNTRSLFQADPNVAGFNQEQVLILVDGVPMNSPQTGHHNFNLPLDIEQVERIEVTKTGISALFGSSGPGGLVNIITSRNNSASLSYGSFGTWRASTSGRSGGLQFWAGGLGSDGYLPGTDGDRYYARIGGDARAGRLCLKAWGAFSRDRFGASGFYGSYPSHEALDRITGALQLLRPLGESTLLSADYSLLLGRDRFRLWREEPERYENDHQTWKHSIDVALKRFGTPFSCFAGAAGELDGIDSTGLRQGVEMPALGSHRRQSVSLYGGINWEGRRFFLSPALRLTSGSHTFFSGQLGGGITLGRGLKVSAGLYRSCRVPTYTELYYSDPVHAANPELEPEKTLGLETRLEWARADRQAGIKLFAGRTDDMIEWSRSGEETLWVSRNVRRADSRGLELFASLASGDTRWRFSYTWQQADFSADPDVSMLKYHFYRPDHLLSLTVTRQWGRFFATPALRLEAAEGVVHPYLGLRVGVTLKKLRLTCDLLNLLDQRVERVPGIPESPRSLALYLTYDI